jgi:hypothetical protein
MKKFFTLIFNIATWGYFCYEVPVLIKHKQSIKRLETTKERLDSLNIKYNEAILEINNKIKLLKNG